MTTKFKISEPGALVAGMPGILGFKPEQSLCVVPIKGGDLACVMRVDLADADESTCGRLAAITGKHGDSALAVIFDTTDADHEKIADYLHAALVGNGIDLLAVTVTDGTAWWCYCGCGNGGPVPDALDSEINFAAVMDGRPINRTRAEMIGTLAPAGDVLAVTDVVSALPYTADEALGVVKSAVDLSRLAVTISDGTIRDRFYALAVDKVKASQVEALFVDAARSLPGDYRADALTMVAFFAYCRGDGPLAGEALVGALKINPQHKMANMLDTALQNGVEPAIVRRLATASTNSN